MLKEVIQTEENDCRWEYEYIQRKKSTGNGNMGKHELLFKCL